MKYLLSTIVLCFVLLSGVSLVHAASACGTLTTDNYQSCCVDYQVASSDDCSTFQAQTAKGDTTPVVSCSSIDESNYDYCCHETANAYTHADACANYKAPQQVGGGATQATNAVNGNSTVSNTGAVSYQSPTTASNASTAALASCTAIRFNTVLDIAIWVKCIIGVVVIPGIFLLAFVVFLWGVFKFIRSSSDTDKQDSKQFIFMGLIGLFVMVGVWGIIKILTTTLGVSSVVPALQTPDKTSK